MGEIVANQCIITGGMSGDSSIDLTDMYKSDAIQPVLWKPYRFHNYPSMHFTGRLANVIAG